MCKKTSSTCKKGIKLSMYGAFKLVLKLFFLFVIMYLSLIFNDRSLPKYLHYKIDLNILKYIAFNLNIVFCKFYSIGIIFD